MTNLVTTVTGTPTYNSGNAKFGSYGLSGAGLRGVGIDDFLSSTGADGGSLTTGTVEAWVKATTAGALKVIAAHPGWWYLGMDSAGKAYFEYGWGSGAFTGLTGTTTIGNGAWHHVAIVLTAGAGSLYVDGTREATSAQTRNAVGSDGNKFMVGTHTNNAGSFLWPGSIDEVRVSNVARYTGTTYTTPTAAFTADANTVGLYHFEGTGQNAVTYLRTNHVKNPSFGTDLTGYTSQQSTTQTRDTTEFLYGTASLKCVVTGAARIAVYGATGAAVANADAIPVVLGESVTFSAYVKPNNSTPLRVIISWFNSSNTWLANSDGTLAAQTANVWSQMSITGTAPANATKCGVSLYANGSITVYTDGWLIEKSAVPGLGRYFDGSTSSAGYANAWTGTAHASTSTSTSKGAVVRTNYFTQPSLESNLPSGGNVTQSGSTTTGIISGTKSLALAATGASNDSYAETNVPGTVYSGGLIVGQTYTISASVTLTAPIGGTLHSRALRIDVFTKVGAGGYVENLTSQAPNVAGTTRVSGTFTVPSGVTELFFRFYHGGTSGTVYWDGILLEAGSTLGNYFDGSMVTAGLLRDWAGPAHDSTSQEIATATVKSREAGSWVTRTGVPKAWVAGTSSWTVGNPKRWNGTAWVDLA